MLPGCPKENGVQAEGTAWVKASVGKAHGAPRIGTVALRGTGSFRERDGLGFPCPSS